MPTDTRARLVSVVRRRDADLAEAALLVAAEADPQVDVDAYLLRIDALADGLRTRGFVRSEPATDARALASYLADELGFGGYPHQADGPEAGLLTHVLDARAGLPITLSILYIAIARRVGVPAFGIGLPGHFLTGIGSGERPVVVDPFFGGVILDESAVDRRVREATGGQVAFTRSMLRPAPAAEVVRRVLNNLTRDFLHHGSAEDALWTIELKQLLPNSHPDDLKMLGEILGNLGRFRSAAAAFEAYLEAFPDAPDHDEITRQAIRSRAKLN